jgi:fructoselysine-6-P-deglycase FrlB-like protein
MTHIEVEIASQPDCWYKAVQLAGDVAAALPQRGERVAVAGCGTSLYAAQVLAGLRESSGHGETDAFPASEMPDGRSYDRVLTLTRSGTTTEVLGLLVRLRRTTRTVAITASASTPVTEAADEAVVLDFADERSVVQTRFPTTVLALLRAHLGEDLTSVIAQAESAKTEILPDELVTRTQFTFLGRGWTVGLANEAALKVRETSQSWTESYPAMEYRHGPMSVADERSVTWMLGSPPDGLAQEVARTGALWVASDLDPMAELVRAQRLAVAMAEARGLDPDSPRNLTRSIVLDRV